MNATRIETTLPGQSPQAETGSPPYTQTRQAARSRKAIWTGRSLTGLAALFLAFDVVGKLLVLPPVVEATTHLGFPAGAVVGIGLLQFVCLIAYLVPRTALIGAVLETGYLGGAVAANVRIGNPLFSHTLFPVYFAALLWAGLWLRDGRVDALLAAPSAAKR